MAAKTEKVIAGAHIRGCLTPRRKAPSRVMAGLTTASLLAATLCECATGAEPPTQVLQGPITLAEAIDISLANNPELAAQYYGVNAAGAQRDIAIGDRLPDIRLQGGYEFYREPRLIRPRRPGTYDVLSFTDELLL